MRNMRRLLAAVSALAVCVSVGCGHAPPAEKIRAAFKPLGTGRLRFVLNTHFHFDHTGSNVVFGTEAPIVAHANVRRRLASGARVLGRDFQPSPASALPVITY